MSKLKKSLSLYNKKMRTQKSAEAVFIFFKFVQLFFEFSQLLLYKQTF